MKTTKTLEQEEAEYMVLPNETPLVIDPEADWVTVAPYGSWRHARGMQVFEKSDAEAIASDFHSLPNVATRVVGLPWYIGHPDHPEFRNRYADTRAYGRIKALRAGETGLEARVKWSTAGKELVNEGAFHGHSPNWLGVPDSGNRWRPRKLKSVGFTNEPNIPVPPVTRANEKEKPKTTTKKKMDERIREQLLAAGVIQPGATDDDVRAGVQNLCNEAADLRKQKATLEQRAKDAEAQLANEQQAKTAAETAKTEAETALANERKERATLVVDAAVARGAVKTGEREEKITALANETDGGKFDAALTALANETGAGMKTASTVGNLGGRAGQGKRADLGIREQVEELANEMTGGGPITTQVYDAAYAKLKKTKPELFEATA